MATLDVLTLDEAKLAISNNAQNANDAVLGSYVTGVSLFLDRVCGPVVKRTVTAEPVDGAGMYAFLTQRPVASVTSVTEYRGVTAVTVAQQVNGATPAEGFVLLPGGRLARRQSGTPACWADGEGNITVTYVAGRFADTSSVDERFKLAAGFVLANFYRRERGMGSEPGVGATFALPNAAAAVLADELLIVS